MMHKAYAKVDIQKLLLQDSASVHRLAKTLLILQKLNLVMWKKEEFYG